MPVIFVWGLASMDSFGQKCLKQDIIKAVIAIPELELSEEDVSVFFPAIHALDEEREEIIVSVKYLFQKPKRTLAVRRKLAKSLAVVLTHFSLSPTEVFIERFNPKTEAFA